MIGIIARSGQTNAFHKAVEYILMVARAARAEVDRVNSQPVFFAILSLVSLYSHPRLRHAQSFCNFSVVQ